MHGLADGSKPKTPLIMIYLDIKMMKSCYVHINMCINIRLAYKIIAYSCSVLFLAYKNSKFKVGGVATESGEDACYVVTMPTATAADHFVQLPDVL